MWNLAQAAEKERINTEHTEMRKHRVHRKINAKRRGGLNVLCARRANPHGPVHAPGKEERQVPM